MPSLLPIAAPAAGVRRNALAGEEQNAGLDALRRVAPARREMASRLPGQAPGLRRDTIRRNRRPPCVNSAGQSEAVPFPDIGDRYVLAGAQCGPQVLARLSQAKTAN